MLALEKGLAEPLIILVQKKKSFGLSVFLLTRHHHLGWRQAQDTAKVPLQNRVRGELDLIEYLHVGRQTLAL